jgi:hypothetical protein
MKRIRLEVVTHDLNQESRKRFHPHSLILSQRLVIGRAGAMFLDCASDGRAHVPNPAVAIGRRPDRSDTDGGPHTLQVDLEFLARGTVIDPHGALRAAVVGSRAVAYSSKCSERKSAVFVLE